jgi:hypothetical protein
LADPEDVSKYSLGLLWAKNPSYDPTLGNSLTIPVDGRTTASFTGISDYVYYRVGGASWSMPYLAGVYALVLQVNPAIQPEQFLDLALQTGQLLNQISGDHRYVLIDPVRLVQAVQ